MVEKFLRDMNNSIVWGVRCVTKWVISKADCDLAIRAFPKFLRSLHDFYINLPLLRWFWNYVRKFEENNCHGVEIQRTSANNTWVKTRGLSLFLHFVDNFQKWSKTSNNCWDLWKLLFTSKFPMWLPPRVKI